MFPSVTFAHGFVRYGDSVNYRNTETTYAVQDSLMLIRAKHAFKVGFEIQRHVDTDNTQSTGAGLFSFSNLETALPGRGATGNAIASFLLAKWTAPKRPSSAPNWPRLALLLRLPAGRFQGQPKLTLNLGLRWEVQTSYGDSAHRLCYMDPFLPNPGAGGRLGAYTFAGPSRGGWDRPADTRFNDFGGASALRITFRELGGAGRIRNLLLRHHGLHQPGNSRKRIQYQRIFLFRGHGRDTCVQLEQRIPTELPASADHFSHRAEWTGRPSMI